MKPYTLTLFLLLAGFSLRAQLQRGDWLLSFSDRVNFNPVPAPAGLSDQLAGIRTYPGASTAIYLSPQAHYLFRDRWAVGGGATSIFGFGSGVNGGVLLEPVLRHYLVNRAPWMLYAQLGPQFRYSTEDGVAVPVAGGLGVHLPVDSAILLTPALTASFDGDRVTPSFDLGLTLLFGRGSTTAEFAAPIARGRTMLGSSSLSITQGRTFWAYQAEVSGHYFLSDRLALGLRLLGSGYRFRAGGEADSEFTPGLGLRYYLRPAGRLYGFGEVGLDFTGEGAKPHAVVGIDYFILPRIAVEYGLPFQESLNRITFGQSAGFRILLGNARK